MLKNSNRSSRFKLPGWIVGPLSFVLLIAFWYGLIWVGDISPYLLPAPDKVFRRFIRAFDDVRLSYHFYITFREVIFGLLIGTFVATILGYLLAKSRLLEQLLSPLLVTSQSVPIVAIAPLLVIWFGPGITSKIFISALIVFFPILINTLVGIRSVPKDLYDLMRSLQASRWDIFRYLEIPAALPVLLGGLRIGATLSVIGAVVGEFMGADRGLGFLISIGNSQFDTSLVFVAVFALVALALSLYGSVVLMEKKFLSWTEPNDQQITTSIKLGEK